MGDVAALKKHVQVGMPLLGLFVLRDLEKVDAAL